MHNLWQCSTQYCSTVILPSLLHLLSSRSHTHTHTRARARGGGGGGIYNESANPQGTVSHPAPLIMDQLCIGIELTPKGC